MSAPDFTLPAGVLIIIGAALIIKGVCVLFGPKQEADYVAKASQRIARRKAR